MAQSGVNMSAVGVSLIPGGATLAINTTTITGGTDTRVLFDDSGVVGESAGLTFTKGNGGTTSVLAAGGLATIGVSLAIGGAAIGTNGLAVTGTAQFSGNLLFSVAAAGITYKQGANGLCGTFVANGVTPVTVSNTNVAITDSIIISLNTIGGTVGVQPHVATITAATGFTVVCTAVDTSTYNYAIIKNAA